MMLVITDAGLQAIGVAVDEQTSTQSRHASHPGMGRRGASGEAVVVHLFETGAAGRLNAAIAEQTAQIYADVATPLNFSEMLHAGNPRFKTWQKIKDILSHLDPVDPRVHLAANALASCFAKKQLGSPDDAETVFAAWMDTDARLTGEAA